MQIKGNLIAHRGVHNNKDVPENSMKAFRRALELEYPIELDVQLTKDNVVVVFHDFNLVRMANKTEYIQDMTYEELKKVQLLDTNETIPTLKEVLDLVQGKVLLDIEIKNTKKIKEVCERVVQETKDYHNFILKSFNPRIVKYLRKHYPNLEVGLLIADHYQNKVYDRLLTSNFILNYVHPDFIAIHKKLLENKRFIEIAKVIPTFIWTIKNKEEIDNHSNLIYICNNLPYE